jgi:hypothetical protein
VKALKQSGFFSAPDLPVGGMHEVLHGYLFFRGVQFWG